MEDEESCLWVLLEKITINNVDTKLNICKNINSLLELQSKLKMCTKSIKYYINYHTATYFPCRM
jgi:hypothetical protein